MTYNIYRIFEPKSSKFKTLTYTFYKKIVLSWIMLIVKHGRAFMTTTHYQQFIRCNPTGVVVLDYLVDTQVSIPHATTLGQEGSPVKRNSFGCVYKDFTKRVKFPNINVYIPLNGLLSIEQNTYSSKNGTCEQNSWVCYRMGLGLIMLDYSCIMKHFFNYVFWPYTASNVTKSKFG